MRGTLILLQLVGCDLPDAGPGDHADGGVGDHAGGETDSDELGAGNDAPVQPAFSAAVVDADTVYPSATLDGDRALGLRIQVPVGAEGARPVILISHGGLGAANGETLFDRLGTGLATYGFIVVQVGHRPTSGCPLRDPYDRSCLDHFRDRPADITAALDALPTIDLQAVAGTDLSADLGAVGHTGHSAGAYTSLAVGGAAYPHDLGGVYADPRIRAIAPISSQGLGDVFQADADTFGAVGVPTLLWFGGDELDTNGAGTFVEDGWRLRPFVDGLYSTVADRIAIVVPGQDHAEMGGRASAEIVDLQIANLAAFFAFMLEGRGDLCAVGPLSADGLDLDVRRQPATGSTDLGGCP